MGLFDRVKKEATRFQSNVKKGIPSVVSTSQVKPSPVPAVNFSSQTQNFTPAPKAPVQNFTPAPLQSTQQAPPPIQATAPDPNALARQQLAAENVQFQPADVPPPIPVDRANASSVLRGTNNDLFVEGKNGFKKTSDAELQSLANKGAVQTKPEVDPLQSQMEALRQQYLQSLLPSQEQNDLQNQITTLLGQGNIAQAQALENAANLSGQGRGITLDLVTGQQGALQRAGQLAKQTSAAEALPLEQRLANLIGQKGQAQKAADAQMGFLQEDITGQREQSQADASQLQAIALSAKQSGAGDDVIAGILNAGSFNEALSAAGTFLTPAVDPTKALDLEKKQLEVKKLRQSLSGDLSDSELNDMLSVSEAESLGVPFGTTKGEAVGRAVSGKPTEGQSKARQFATTAQEANLNLINSGYDPGLVEVGFLPNQFKGEKRELFEQAARSLVNAVLRRESGAVINDDEFKNKYKELIPQAGESDGVKEQKARSRETAIDAIAEAGGEQQFDNVDSYLDSKSSFSNDMSKSKKGSAKTIASAIKQVESGGNYDAKGASGESGAYQFMPATWKQWAGQFLGNSNAPQTRANQDKVAESKIQDLLDQGRSPREIALIWNGGQPIVKKGVNKFGVAFDSGAYANKVLTALG